MCYSSRATATCLRALRDGVRPAWRGLGLCDGLAQQHLVAHVLGIRRLHKHLRADADLRRWRRGRWRHRRRWHAARADNAHMRLKTTSHSSVQYLWHQRQLKSVFVIIKTTTTVCAFDLFVHFLHGLAYLILNRCIGADISHDVVRGLNGWWHDSWWGRFSWNWQNIAFWKQPGILIKIWYVKSNVIPLPLKDIRLPRLVEQSFTSVKIWRVKHSGARYHNVLNQNALR